MLGISTASAVAGNRNSCYAAGLVVVNDDLASSAITQPDPELDNADWFWHFFGAFSYHRVAGGSNLSADRVRIDTKSKRRMRQQQRDFMLICKNSSASNDSLTFSVQLRILLKLN